MPTRLPESGTRVPDSGRRVDLRGTLLDSKISVLRGTAVIFDHFVSALVSPTLGDVSTSSLCVPDSGRRVDIRNYRIIWYYSRKQLYRLAQSRK